MKKKLIALCLTAAMTASMLIGCSTEGDKDSEPADNTQEDSSKETDANEGTAKDKIVVGATFQNLSEEFITMLKEAMEIQLEEYDNVELIINDAESMPDKQSAQLDSFIAQGVDAVIINPCDANALIPAIKDVVDAGIPCITLSSDIEEEVGQIWVGSENADAGILSAEYAVEIMDGKGDVAVLRLMLGAFAEIGRMEGYEEVLDKNPDMPIVFDQTGNAQRDEGMALMENWLSTGTNIDVVLAQNDAMALGALEAIKAAGKMDDIKVIGIDAIEDALDSVKAGEMAATCFQDAIGQGKGALEMAVRAANGEPIERNNIPFELVTIDNVDEYYSRIKLPD